MSRVVASRVGAALVTARSVTAGSVGESEEAGAAFSVAITGLSSGDAWIGDEATISYTIDPDNGTETVAWGTTVGDSTYGTGANPTDFTAGDEGRLWLTVTDGGETVSRSARIRYAAGTAPAIADGQAWTVDDTSVSIDAAASGSNLTWTYAASGLPTGVSINSGSGLISGTPTAVDSGTVTVTATDQYGRTVSDTFTFANTLRTQAVAAGGLGPYSFTTGSAITPIATSSDFTLNGNTLTYTISPALPAGLSLATDGALSGTPTVASSSTTYTVTGQDEYGRETDSAFDLQTQVFSILDLVPGGSTNSVYVNFTDASLIYKESAGSLVNVDTVGDDIALILDPSQGTTSISEGLGAEIWDETSSPFIIQDGTSDGAYDGAGRFTCSGGSTVSFRPEFLFTSLPTSAAGELFSVELQFTVVSGGTNLRISYGGGILFEIFGALSAGTYTVTRVVRSEGTAALSVRADGQLAFDFTIDSLSLRQLGPGNHVTQPTATSQMKWGRYPAGGVRNLLVQTEDLEGDQWYGSATPTGRVISAGGAGIISWNQAYIVPTVASEQVTARVQATNVSGSGTWRIALQETDAGGAGVLTTAFAGTVSLSGTPTEISVSLTATGGGNRYILLLQRVSGADGDEARFEDIQLERGGTATDYQHRAARWDITEAGVPSISAAWADGADDFLRTSSIDMTGTDNSTLAVAFLVTEPPTTAFDAIADKTVPRLSLIQSSGRFSYNSGGSTPRGVAASTIVANAPEFLIGRNDISEDLLNIRDSRGTASNGADQGTGNLTDSPLFIGRNAASSTNYFNGFYVALLLLPVDVSDADADNLETEFTNMAGIT